MEYIKNPFFKTLSIEELKLLSAITDELFQSNDSHWKNLMEEIIYEPKCEGNTYVMFHAFMMYVIIQSREDTEQIINPFFDISLDMMPIYFIPNPMSGVEPFLWQSLLAKWRLCISR